MSDEITANPSGPRASIVVTCKGRLHHLRQTLPKMAAQVCDFDYEIIVVDFGCPDGTFDWCRSLNLPRVKALRVLDDTDEFHVSRARNCGARQAGGGVLAFVDADVLLDVRWLATAAAPILAANAGLVLVAPHNVRTGWDRIGTCAVSAAVFHQVRGYDEGFRGWGGEDRDFYARCQAVTKVARFPASLLVPIQHGNDERTRHYREKSIERTCYKNRVYEQNRHGQVNVGGYGRGQVSGP